MFAVIRVLLGIAGVLALTIAAILLATGNPGFLSPLLMGAVALVAALWERTRYRSEAAESSSAPAGPGGGEPHGALEPRFGSTEEMFIDPVSGRRMRVFLDPRTGERRYRADG